MNKDSFLKEIKKQFLFLDKEELEDVLNDYAEHFAMGLEAGRTEEEIAASLGDPKTLSKQYLAEFRLEQAKNKATPGNIARALLAVVALGLFNVIVMLGPIMAIFSIFLALFIIALALLGSGIAMMIFALPLFTGMATGAVFLTGVAIAALGVIFLVLAWGGTKLFGSLLIRYIQKNIDIIKD